MATLAPTYGAAGGDEDPQKPPGTPRSSTPESEPNFPITLKTCGRCQFVHKTCDSSKPACSRCVRAKVQCVYLAPKFPNAINWRTRMAAAGKDSQSPQQQRQPVQQRPFPQEWQTSFPRQQSHDPQTSQTPQAPQALGQHPRALPSPQTAQPVQQQGPPPQVPPQGSQTYTQDLEQYVNTLERRNRETETALSNALYELAQHQQSPYYSRYYPNRSPELSLPAIGSMTQDQRCDMVASFNRYPLHNAAQVNAWWFAAVGLGSGQGQGPGQSGQPIGAGAGPVDGTNGQDNDEAGAENDDDTMVDMGESEGK